MNEVKEETLTEEVKDESKTEEVIVEKIETESAKDNESKDELNDEKKSSKKTEQNKSSKKNTLLKIFKKVYQTRLFILLIGVLLLLKTIFLYKTEFYIGKPLKFQHIYMASAFIGIILTLPMLLKGKVRMWVALLVDLLISILLFINELYYSYSSNLVSIAQISNLQYGKEISAALPNLLRIRQIFYFVDIVAILSIYFIFRKHLKDKTKSSWKPGFIYAVIMVVLAVTINYTWLRESQVHQYNKILQIETSSIYGYQFLDIRNNLNMKRNVKYKSKDAMLNAYNELMTEYDEKYQSQYDFQGIAKDKNVIIVQLESVQNFVVNRTINGKEITPNFNKFLKENIRFTNMQNQSYTTTADSEFTVMTSLYPLENGMSYAQYSSNDYNDIYENFKNNGYSTTYIHGNTGSFWNRQAVYSRLDIDHLYFDDIFPEDVERINDYVSDEEVYKRMIEEMKSYHDEKFFVNIIAASSHTAFDLPGIRDKDKKVSIDVGDEYRGTYFGNYLEAVNYADYAFGLFIDGLKEAGLYDDTVILIYGDHAGLQMYNEEMMEYLRGITPMNDIEMQINYTNILCGLRIPGVEPMEINKPASKIDLKPTLMEICGIEDIFSLGRSMFSNKEFVCINNGKIITDKYYFDGTWYSIETGEQLDESNMPKEEVEKLSQYTGFLQRELDISLSTNILNLLKK